MKENDLKQRTKNFALRVILMTEALPKTRAADVIARQLLRSSTSVAANYRSACRGRSKNEFIAKLGVVEEECDESSFWMELIEEAALLPAAKLKALRQEADELTAIAVSSIRTAKKQHHPAEA